MINYLEHLLDAAEAAAAEGMAFPAQEEIGTLRRLAELPLKALERLTGQNFLPDEERDGVARSRTGGETARTDAPALGESNFLPVQHLWRAGEDGVAVLFRSLAEHDAVQRRLTAGRSAGTAAVVGEAVGRSAVRAPDGMVGLSADGLDKLMERDARRYSGPFSLY